MIYRKYIFPTDFEHGLDSPVMLGHPEIKPLILDAEGEVIQEWELDMTSVMVDALLEAERPDLVQYETWPANPKHHFGGWEETYHAERITK